MAGSNHAMKEFLSRKQIIDICCCAYDSLSKTKSVGVRGENKCDRLGIDVIAIN